MTATATLNESKQPHSHSLGGNILDWVINKPQIS